MWTMFKVFIEFVTKLILFSDWFVLFFWLCGMWGLRSPTRDQTWTLCTGRHSFNHFHQGSSAVVVVSSESHWARNTEPSLMEETHGLVLTCLWHISIPNACITLFYVCFYLNTRYLMCIVTSQH